MRTEQEMYETILDIARKDDRVKADYARIKAGEIKEVY